MTILWGNNGLIDWVTFDSYSNERRKRTLEVAANYFISISSAIGVQSGVKDLTEHRTKHLSLDSLRNRVFDLQSQKKIFSKQKFKSAHEETTYLECEKIVSNPNDKYQFNLIEKNSFAFKLWLVRHWEKNISYDFNAIVNWGDYQKLNDVSRAELLKSADLYYRSRALLLGIQSPLHVKDEDAIIESFLHTRDLFERLEATSRRYRELSFADFVEAGTGFELENFLETIKIGDNKNTVLIWNIKCFESLSKSGLLDFRFGD